jgi:hypothetical protein
VGKPEENKLFERHRRRWDDNIEMDLQYLGWWHGLDWQMVD